MSTATDAVKAHVRKILDMHAAYRAALAARVREIEAEGGRVIETRSWGENGSGGERGWEIVDWLAGDVIATSRDCGSRDEALEGLCSGDIWDVDAVALDIEFPEPSPTDGVPESLARLLSEWVDPYTAAEVASFVGRDAADVERCLDHPE